MTTQKKPMEVTFELPDEIVSELQSYRDKLPQIIALSIFRTSCQNG